MLRPAPLLLALLTACALSGCPRPAALMRPAEGDTEARHGRYVFTQDWFSHLKPRLGELVGQHVPQPARYLEIGAGEGVAFFWMMDQVLKHPQSRGTAVLSGYDGDLHARFYANFAANPRSWRLDVRKATASAAITRMEPDGTVDVLFVHGASSAPETLGDLVVAWGALRWGGVLIVDDYKQRPGWPSELRAATGIDAFITAYRQQLTLLHRGDLVVLKKRFPCGDECTTWRGFTYDWRKRVLVNDGTGQPVDLSAEEQQLVENLLRASPYGEPAPVAPAHLATLPQYPALARRLGWRATED